ncbi:hypothetical protein [Stygiobacter electus]|uniref:Uncharacterized protein n=1 Tax=Stygiobacter electus TaxID=3032292 RepID=A0AAE3P2N0_9BACT|nr:hypothetical protein [Stygiobacter electus]MDF1613279.1 hypothetical protein [Stygiobacter electus]
MAHQDTIQVVKPGDGIVTGKKIPAYKNSWEMTAVNPDGTVINRGIWNDEISFYTNNDGDEILKRKQKVEYKDRISIQEEEVYRDNLQHIHLKIYNVNEEPHTDIYYSAHKIWGKKIFRVDGLNDIEQMPISFFFYELPQPVFDWHLWGILISGFPLKVGYQARFLAHESYSYLPGDFRWFTLKVTGTDTINGGIWGNVNCYTVDVEAEVLWKIWIAIDKSIPPVQQIRIDDKDGIQFWWKPIKK